MFIAFEVALIPVEYKAVLLCRHSEIFTCEAIPELTLRVSRYSFGIAISCRYYAGDCAGETVQKGCLENGSTEKLCFIPENACFGEQSCRTVVFCSRNALFWEQSCRTVVFCSRKCLFWEQSCRTVVFRSRNARFWGTIVQKNCALFPERCKKMQKSAMFRFFLLRFTLHFVILMKDIKG